MMDRAGCVRVCHKIGINLDPLGTNLSIKPSFMRIEEHTLSRILSIRSLFKKTKKQLKSDPVRPKLKIRLTSITNGEHIISHTHEIINSDVFRKGHQFGLMSDWTGPQLGSGIHLKSIEEASTLPPSKEAMYMVRKWLQYVAKLGHEKRNISRKGCNGTRYSITAGVSKQVQPLAHHSMMTKLLVSLYNYSNIGVCRIQLGWEIWAELGESPNSAVENTLLRMKWTDEVSLSLARILQQILLMRCLPYVQNCSKILVHTRLTGSQFLPRLLVWELLHYENVSPWCYLEIISRMKLQNCGRSKARTYLNSTTVLGASASYNSISLSVDWGLINPAGHHSTSTARSARGRHGR